MSVEREAVKVKSSWDSTKSTDNVETQTSADNTQPENDPLAERAKRKAKLVSILDRGIVADRLRVELPSDKYGEWVADDPVEIARMEAMGFRRDTEYSTARSLHSTGVKEGKVGDVIFMVCEKETKEIIDEIRREQYNRRHGKGKTREESEASSKINREGLATFTESKEHVARKADIESALSTSG